MKFIEERDKRTKRRRIAKKIWDEQINLARQDEYVRLLDDGAIVASDGSIAYYLLKGSVAKYYNELSDDFEGIITLGHLDFAVFPFIFGKWKKSDLRLTVDEDGFGHLDVRLNLDKENILLQEFRRQGIDLGVSASFTYEYDAELSRKVGVEIDKNIYIFEFSIVGECGNVNSSNTVIGGKNMSIEELNKALDNVNDLSEAKLALDELMSEEPEEVKEEPVQPEEAEKAPEEAEPVEAEPAGEPAEEPEGDKEPEAPADGLSDALAAAANMQKEIEELKVTVLKLEKQLAEKVDAEREFVKKFKNLSISLSTPKEPEIAEESATNVVFTNGIGA